jgi:ABC-type transporter Mla subunit MlaD
MKILFVIILSTAVFAFSSCKEKGYKLFVLFNDVTGLKKGSEVKLNGLPVGTVTRMKLHDSVVLVTLFFPGDLNIPGNSSFVLDRELHGTSYINIFSSGDSIALHPGDTARGVDYKSRQISPGDSLKRSRKMKALKKITEGFKELFETADSAIVPKY